MALRFKEGDRVELTRLDFHSGIPKGAQGTVEKVATIGGKSIYADPLKKLLMVRWDKYRPHSVPKGLVKRAPKAKKKSVYDQPAFKKAEEKVKEMRRRLKKNPNDPVAKKYLGIKNPCSRRHAVKRLSGYPKGEEDTTPVIFRKWKAQPQDVIALFPTIPADAQGLHIQSFEHVGQHGAAHYSIVNNLTKPATPAEYRDLKQELESPPYNYKLRVYKRYQPWMRKKYNENLRGDLGCAKLAGYMGHRSKAAWNVALWIGNDYGLYKRAVGLIREYDQKYGSRKLALDRAARELLAELPEKTPDGYRYTKTSIREALRGLEIERLGNPCGKLGNAEFSQTEKAYRVHVDSPTHPHVITYPPRGHDLYTEREARKIMRDMVKKGMKKSQVWAESRRRRFDLDSPVGKLGDYTCNPCGLRRSRRTALAGYMGHRSKAAWNVALWVGNDYNLYKTAIYLKRRHGTDEAARILLQELPATTPDGYKYTITSLKEALRGLE